MTGTTTVPTPLAPPRPRRRPLGLALATALLVPAAAPAAPAAAAGSDPVGTWPLAALPAAPVVVHGFDPPDVRWGSGHRGVDLAGRAGEAVLAALPGTVTHAAPIAGVGVVVVDHGATRTTYQPVEASVAVGEQVGAGRLLGALAGAGSHCAPAVCLHWGWVEGSTYLDPLRLVGAGPVRLLPLWRDEPIGVAGVVGAGVVGPVVRAARPARGAPVARGLAASPYAGWRPAVDLRRGGGPAGRPGAAARW